MPVDNDVSLSSWGCEIGSIATHMIPDGGDNPLRNAVAKCWNEMFPGVPFNIASGWGRVTVALPLHEKPEQANLGLASTEEMFAELITRFRFQSEKMWPENSEMIDKAIELAKILGGLNREIAEYRTVDS